MKGTARRLVNSYILFLYELCNSLLIVSIQIFIFIFIFLVALNVHIFVKIVLIRVNKTMPGEKETQVPILQANQIDHSSYYNTRCSFISNSV